MDLVRQALAHRPFIDLIERPDARTGIAAVREQPPDLILLDIHLPDMNGIEALKQMRRENLDTRVPVFAISANTFSSDIDAALMAGFDGYIKKPINIPDFLNLIDAHLLSRHARRTATTPPPPGETPSTRP
ncbi:MAG: response regulator [Leptospirillia bacterium]